MKKEFSLQYNNTWITIFPQVNSSNVKLSTLPRNTPKANLNSITKWFQVPISHET